MVSFNSIAHARRAIPYVSFWGMVSFIYALTVVAGELSSLPMTDLWSWLMTGGQWLMIAIFSSALIGLMTLSRIIFAILFTPFLVLSAVIVFFSITIGTGLTGTTIEIALVNDGAMWASMLSPGLLVTIIIALCSGVMASVIRWRKVNAPKGRRGGWLAVAFILISLLPFAVPSRVSAAIGARMPYAIFFGFYDYAFNRQEILTERHAFDSVPASAGHDAPDVLLVLGESLRADHLPMNGYGRNTMPLLSSDTSVISFPHVRGHAFHTHAAVPLLLTRAEDGDRDRANEEPSFITLFNKAGFTTAWFANQDLGSSYTYFAHEADTLVYTNASRSLYVYSDWLDSDLLGPVGKWLDDDRSGQPHQPHQPRMAVIHSIGSHWWYKSHYKDEDARFLPDTPGKDIGSLTRERIVNAYDNSIVATDRFLAGLISLLRDRNAILIFISDHGEALGEDGRYLHGTDHEVIRNPACLVWTSQEYDRYYPLKTDALRKSCRKQVTTDVIFHTVLDAGAISTPVFNPTLSLLRYDPD